jgi:hypothetical protein
MDTSDCGTIGRSMNKVSVGYCKLKEHLCPNCEECKKEMTVKKRIKEEFKNKITSFLKTFRKKSEA